ncbi:hypothetical protein HHI36_013069 [Cryptolaemus montrouzieri]|uniref:C2H2-type domain-containing protein n=1 Tax=Cryptolaemus montrouzieri TaxID=559131 RepID=A0ABD2NG25_9CUCU
MNFSTSSNILSDSISGYVTADEDDDCDNTHYLSVLSQDISLDEMNITLSNTQVEHNDENDILEQPSEDVGQPLIFTINGSNEIFGVQIAQDEEGNLQKYQIQYTENMNGELVPMMDSIQILSLEEEGNAESSRSNCATPTTNIADEIEETVQTIRNDTFSYNQEACISVEQNSQGEMNLHEDEFELETPNVDCQNSTSSSAATLSAAIKQESLDLFDENTVNEHQRENSENLVCEEIHSEFAIEQVNLKMENNPDALVQIELNTANIVPENQYEITNCIEEHDREDQIIDEENMEAPTFEQFFVEESNISENDNINENDSDNEMYQIVDGVHITGDVENDREQPFPTILKETVDHQTKTNILKRAAQRSVLKDQVVLDEKVIYVHALLEKENMEIMDVSRLSKPNSRSLLKCNQPPQPLLAIPDPLHIEVVPEDKFSKRYSRTKEAKQARQFINFINSTTIPQVPERKERLPRKQQIKPLEHPNDDIVVKEMIVSSSGFIEPISAEEKKYLPVTEYVELLDSGDESNSRAGANKKNKKKSKKQEEAIEIEISDSEESNISVIELDDPMTGSDDESKSKSAPTKKRRGRPPKNREIGTKDVDSISESPSKISRTNTDLDSVTSSLEVIHVENEKDQDSARNCENINQPEQVNKPVKILEDCSGINSIEYCIEDSEPPSNSECEEVEANKEPVKKGESKLTRITSKIEPISNPESVPKKFEYKYECEKCEAKFINKFLLIKHECIVKSTLPYSCSTCQKKFSNMACLNLHKKVHTKLPVVAKAAVTNIPQISKTMPHVNGGVSRRISSVPVRNPSRESILAKNSVRSSVSSSVQIKNVSKESTMARNSMTVQKKAGVSVASTKFVNKLHKPPAPAVVVTPDKNSKSNVFKFEKQCEKCSFRFTSNRAWFDHQVLKHGLRTPDKSIGEKKQKKLVRPTVAHNGISAAPMVTRNFSTLRSKLQQSQ